MEGQLKEMKDAGARTTRHLGLTERPWMSANVTVASPLTIDDNGVHITIRIELMNFGNSPAIGIWIHPLLYLSGIGKPSAVEERARICEEASGHPTGATFLGQMLFPRTIPPHVQNFIINATAEDLKRSRIGGTDDVTGDGPYAKGMYSANIILCVSYRSTIDEVARHYTASIYDLSWFDPERPSILLALPHQPSVPFDRLRLWGSVFGPIAK